MTEAPIKMLVDLIDLLMRPDAYVCMWRDGGLFVEPVPALHPPSPLKALNKRARKLTR